MSAPLCSECEQPRDYGATLLHVCHCDETAGDLRVLMHLRDTEITRLRAALASIAALQTEEPIHPVENCVYDHFGGNADDAFEGGRDYGEDQGLWEAAEMARAALVSK